MFDVRVFSTDTWQVMADKIFYKFEALQSCKIEGIEFLETPNPGKGTGSSMRAFAKGQLVWDRICELDKEQNFDSRGKRKREKIENSNGAVMAHKIFKFKQEETENNIKWTIWRIQ